MKRLKIKLIDRYGPAWDMNDMYLLMMNELADEKGSFLQRKSKMQSEDIKKSEQIMEIAISNFQKSYERFNTVVNSISDLTKKASSNVRKAADDLSSGLAKVEKQANFNNLERYVVLLERAATAMSTLSELEKTGKLDKIAGALK